MGILSVVFGALGPGSVGVSGEFVHPPRFLKKPNPLPVEQSRRRLFVLNARQHERRVKENPG